MTITDRDREAVHALRLRQCSHGYRSWTTCNECIGAAIAQAREEGRAELDAERAAHDETKADAEGWRNGQAQVQRDFDLLYADHQALSAAHRQLQTEVQQKIRASVEAERKRCSQVIREHVHRHGLKGMAEKVLRDAAREIKWCGSR